MTTDNTATNTEEEQRMLQALTECFKRFVSKPGVQEYNQLIKVMEEYQFLILGNHSVCFNIDSVTIVKLLLSAKADGKLKF